jgi:hypothetical protein
MNTMLNPQSFKTSRTPRLALPAAATLLLLVLALLMSFGPVARPAEACPKLPCVDLPPVVTPDNPSVVVEEGQTATNTGTYEDPFEELTAPPSAVTLSASVGTITKSGMTSGT